MNKSGEVNNNDHIPPTVKLDNAKIHLDQVVEAYNVYFLNLVVGFNMEQANMNSAILFLKNLFPDGFPEVIAIPGAETEMICTIAALKKTRTLLIMMKYLKKF
jgi:hypothetical protein